VNLFGRVLQFAGMIILPIGLSIGLFQGDVKMEVRYLAVGAFLFLLGRILTRKTA